MRSDVHLVSIIGTVLFLASASQGFLPEILHFMNICSKNFYFTLGLRCYQCARERCNEMKGDIVDDCPDRCFEVKGTDSSGPLIYIDCDADLKTKVVPLSGCKELEENKDKVKGKICACKRDLCNMNLSRGYTMSYQWIKLAASLLMAISVHDIVL